MNSYFDEAKNKTIECEFIETFEKHFFVENRLMLLRKGLPFIVKDYFISANEGQIIQELNRQFGKRNLKVRKNSNVLDYASNRTYIRMDMHDYLKKMLNDHGTRQPYAANNFIDDNILHLLNIDHPLPEFLGMLRNPKIWIGAKGTSTPLHKDSTDNFAIHLHGEKRWSIFSIRDIDCLYFEKSRYGDYLNPLAEFEVSPIDLGNINHDKFPRYTGAKRIDFIVKKGELLYLPYGWGHMVENISASVMVNFWFELNNYIPFIVL